ncbi:Serine protease 45 [Portunus trituberculatus]|uniref:Serine protease 45 n=1 Tax=Portunus trituberculatus TaxID=210409 RepID=A0A5B7FMV1_PORTR|nr:Serine protease 45 [Portunus trituberculatus]
MNESFKTMFTEEEEFAEQNRALHCRGLQEIIVHKEDIGRPLENLDVRKSTVDGGSPLGCEVGGRWFLTGLVSWSRDCSSSGPAGIYSRTSAFTVILNPFALDVKKARLYDIRVVVPRARAWETRASLSYFVYYAAIF